MSQSLVGGVLLGIGIGVYIPAIPFIGTFNNYIGLILIVIGLIILMRSKN